MSEVHDGPNDYFLADPAGGGEWVKGESVDPEQLHFEGMGFSKQEVRDIIASIRRTLNDARDIAEAYDKEVKE